MNKLFSTLHQDGSRSIWCYDPDQFDEWGEYRGGSVSWWIVSADLKTVDYCRLLGWSFEDPSLIAVEFKSFGQLLKRLWRVHENYKNSGCMNRSIEL